ncbi:uncharacterized protein PHACADRAFT_207427 [Phanerochaete carnosa HHB-10118-sp]|uniref:Tautomerase cis-CaaD-like domain-containing protein n=1 Tax=Phanerochaete carnosa (strain HHB-10118-sp) TaxID=650164 RepID=K5WH08_PHACS|nr:uncharacterized protein PHACADRAFT_207427 [Phanerochaete carnosa HHB-10118-sp]EKM58615.1 hypothetical protein PHACADRAFT_207427 [Phanerochaete carnosa HHB-10118-sp]
MPSLEIRANVKLDDPKKFIEEFSTFAAETLTRPLHCIVVSYTYNEHMAWDGKFDPCFLLDVLILDSIKVPEDVNEQYSKAFFQFIDP